MDSYYDTSISATIANDIPTPSIMLDVPKLSIVTDVPIASVNIISQSSIIIFFGYPPVYQSTY